MRLTTRCSTSRPARCSSLNADAATPATRGRPSISPTEPRSASAPGSRRRRRRAFTVVIAAVIALAALVVAGTPDAMAATPGGAALGAVRVVALAGSVDDVLNNIRNWIMGILALLATVFLTIGGVRYVMAAGDPGEVAKAKIAFKSAAIGYALAALAPLVVTVLKGIVGA
jgi:hypothetical protein